MEKANSAKIGRIGEDIAVKFLKNKGYLVIDRNFRRKFGEIDIICRKNAQLHFVEVKSVSQITSDNLNPEDQYRPEDNLHGNKATRLKRVITSYLSEIAAKEDFQVHLVTVKIDQQKKIAKVMFLEDIIL